MRMNLAATKDVAAIVQACVAVLALAGGAVVAVWFFDELSPGLELSLKVTHRRVSPAANVLFVDADIKNPGKVPLKPHGGYTIVYQVLPVPSQLSKSFVTLAVPDFRPRRSYDWGSQISVYIENEDRYVEPGEHDQLHYELPIPASVCTVKVVSFLRNASRSEYNGPMIDVLTKDLLEKVQGWQQTEIYDLTPTPNSPIANSRAGAGPSQGTQNCF